MSGSDLELNGRKNGLGGDQQVGLSLEESGKELLYLYSREYVRTADVIPGLRTEYSTRSAS